MPVGCVFVLDPGGGADATIIARGSNKTNEFRNVGSLLLHTGFVGHAYYDDVLHVTPFVGH